MRIIKTKHLERFSAYLIFSSAVLIALQTYRIENAEFLYLLHILEFVIIFLFGVEFFIRFNKLHISTKPNISEKVESSYLIVDTKDETRWLVFDGLILFGSIIATFIIVLDYAEFIFIARLIRVFRLFRLFELSSELKSIQKKIFWTFQTVSVFLSLLSIVIFVYSIVGVILFDYEDLGILDFRSVHQAFLSLSVVLIDGFSEAYIVATSSEGSFLWLRILYIASFALISVMVTLNVFIAVLTNQVWDKFQEESDRLLKEAIEKEIDESEKNLLGQINKSQQQILKKLNELEMRNQSR